MTQIPGRTNAGKLIESHNTVVFESPQKKRKMASSIRTWELKTPVTILQELCTKQGQSVTFNLIYNGVGSNNPIFKNEASAFNKSAIGTGKSKKEAKHEAARLLLIELNYISAEVVEEPVISPYADILKENAVGALTDYCIQKSTQMPVYEETRDEGLPHAKVFGYKCIVSSFVTEAESRTKKQAKQLAAQLMLNKLKQFLEEDGNSFSEIGKTKKDMYDELSELETTKAIYALKTADFTEKRKAIVTSPLGIKLYKFHKFYQSEFFPISETLVSLRDKDYKFFQDIENPKELFDEILNELHFTYDIDFDKPAAKKVKIVTVVVGACSAATFVGIAPSMKEATRKAFIEGLKFLTAMSNPVSELPPGEMMTLTGSINNTTKDLIDASPFLK